MKYPECIACTCSGHTTNTMTIPFDNHDLEDNPPRKRIDGKYEQALGDDWMAECFEDPQTGLWRIEVFHHDVAEWTSIGHLSLEEAILAARNYYDQL